MIFQTNLKRPIIPTSFGDKVPSNIRQRYLNIVIEEYLKFSSEETAFQKVIAVLCWDSAKQSVILYSTKKQELNGNYKHSN